MLMREDFSNCYDRKAEGWLSYPLISFHSFIKSSPLIRHIKQTWYVAQKERCILDIEMNTTDDFDCCRHGMKWRCFMRGGVYIKTPPPFFPP